MPPATSLAVFQALAIATCQLVCIVLIALFIVFCCIPSLHHPVRELVRPWVVFHVEGGLGWVAWAQRHQRGWLTHLFDMADKTVGVGFYGSVLPAIIWLGLPELGWHLVILMCLCLYVGNAMKDLVCGPRPLGLQYGKARLKALGKGSKEAEQNAKEFGLPSSHTMNTLCLQFYFVHYLIEHELVSDSTAAVLYTIVTAWVVFIASSRLYLGLHTPIDILAGAVAGLAVVTCFIGLEVFVDAWVRSRQLALPLAAFVSLVLLRLHPRPVNATPTFDFTTSFMGVMTGVCYSVSHNEGFYTPAVQLKSVWAHSPYWIARRLLAGFAVVLVSKAVFKAAAMVALPPLYRGFPLVLRRLWQPPVHNLCDARAIIDPRLKGLPHGPTGRPRDVEATARFFAYAGIGVAACALAPSLFRNLDW